MSKQEQQHLTKATAAGAIRGRVAVVGAGPAGLAMGRALKRAGIDFDILERHSDIGGIWNQSQAGSPVYDSAHFISSRDAVNSTFRGHPFPPGGPVYPSHAQVLDYLRAFAAHEALEPHLRLGAPVVRAERDGAGWRLYGRDWAGEYQALVCASGSLWTPNIPPIAGSDTFGGTIRHSATYRSAQEFKDKRVLIVGAGNSGVDIACDAARNAASTSLSMRRGYWFVPKFIAGAPSDIVLREPGALPAWAHPPDAAALLELLVGRPEKYGLPAPDHAPFASHPIMNSEVLNHFGHGRIRPRPALKRLDGDFAVYADGARERVDEVLLATGFRTEAPYLPEGTLEYDGGNRPSFWMRIVHPKAPNLYSLGFLETNSSVFRLFDLGAEFIAGHIRAGLVDAPARQRIDALVAAGVEPDLNGPVVRTSSERHVGYVDSRLYAQALTGLITEHFGDPLLA